MEAALQGQVHPFVVDAYTAYLRSRRPTACIATCEEAARLIASPSRARSMGPTVALPLLCAEAWMLVIIQFASDCLVWRGTLLCKDGRRVATSDPVALRDMTRMTLGKPTAGNDGLDLLSWLAALADGRDVRSADTLGPKLELMTLDIPSSPKAPQRVSKVPDVVRADLRSQYACLSDDTVDTYTKYLHSKAPAGQLAFVQAAEVVSWVAVSRGRDAAERDECTRGMRERFDSAPCVLMPMNASGHWALVIANQPAGIMYVLDSISGSTVAHALVSACRTMLPEACSAMRVVKVHVPLQSDAVNCGVYMLEFMGALCGWIQRAQAGAGFRWGDDPEFWKDIRIHVVESRDRMLRELS